MLRREAILLQPTSWATPPDIFGRPLSSLLKPTAQSEKDKPKDLDNKALAVPGDGAIGMQKSGRTSSVIPFTRMPEHADLTLDVKGYPKLAPTRRSFKSDAPSSNSSSCISINQRSSRFHTDASHRSFDGRDRTFLTSIDQKSEFREEKSIEVHYRPESYNYRKSSSPFRRLSCRARRIFQSA
eukprot:198058_1